MTAPLSQILKILLLTLALYMLLSELDSDQNVFADLKSGPGIKKLDAKPYLCLHQWRLSIYQARPSSLPWNIFFVKLASHLIKKKVPYFEVSAFWKGILIALWFKIASMTSSNSSPWSFTHLCGKILELTVQLVLKKKSEEMLLHRIELHHTLLRNVPLLFAVIVKNNCPDMEELNGHFRYHWSMGIEVQSPLHWQVGKKKGNNQS